MKKLMIIAAIVSGMLMPAQVFANNDRGERKVANGVERVNVDHNRVKDNKNGKDVKDVAPKPAPAPIANKPKPAPAPIANKPKPAPAPVAHKPKPAPAPVVHNPKPAPMVNHNHCAPAPVVHHHDCDDGVVEAAAVIVGLVGLISALAN